MGRSCYCCDKFPAEECVICPDILESTGIQKSKFILSGFQDYNIDFSYSGPFTTIATRKTIQGILLKDRPSIGYDPDGPITYGPGINLQGEASYRYFLNISGLSQLNTESIFHLDNGRFVPEQEIKFLGEITVENFIEISIQGTAYAFFPEPYLDINCSEACGLLEPCKNRPFPLLDKCNFNNIRTIFNCPYTAPIPPEWSGKHGSLSKYDIYLISETYSCDLGKSIRLPLEQGGRVDGTICSDPIYIIGGGIDYTLHLNHMPFDRNGSSGPVRYMIVLKQSEPIEDGVYKHVGFRRKDLITLPPCYPANFFGQQVGCPNDPCESIVLKTVTECRNSFYDKDIVGIFNLYALHTDIVEKAYLSECVGGRCDGTPGGGPNFDILERTCFCLNACPNPPYPPFSLCSQSCPQPIGSAYKLWGFCRKFINHRNFAPLYVSGLLHTPYMDISAPNICNIDSLPNAIAYCNIGFESTRFNPCFNLLDNPCEFCNSYNAATKKIQQKYRIALNRPIFAPRNDFSVNISSPTNYSKVLSPCDDLLFSACDSPPDISTSTGVGVYDFYRTSKIDFLAMVLSWPEKSDELPDLPTLGPLLRVNSDDGCFDLYMPVDAPFQWSNSIGDRGWGASEIKFTKYKDSVGTFNPLINTKYYCRPDNEYCNKTFNNYPTIDNWTMIPKNNDEIIAAIGTENVKYNMSFKIPRPPQYTLEVIYEE